MTRYENFRQIDIDDLNAEAKRADAKFGSQLDVPLGTSEFSFPMLKMQIMAWNGGDQMHGHHTAVYLADLAKRTTDTAFSDAIPAVPLEEVEHLQPEGTWLDILLEEVFEASAEIGGVVGGEKLEAELLQIAAVALRMREVARHHRIIAEMRQREQDTIEKYGVFPNCHHRNYGTKEKPASVFIDCIDCREYYCDACNYDRHQCGGCGESYRHGEDPHPGVSCVDDEVMEK